MATRKKKQPWNAGKNLFPSLTGGEVQPLPKPMKFSGLVGQSTPGAPVEDWACLLCEQLAAGVAPTVPEHSLRCPKREPVPKG